MALECNKIPTNRHKQKLQCQKQALLCKQDASTSQIKRFSLSAENIKVHLHHYD